MKCFIHSFIHSFHFIFLIYSAVEIFVFISTIHLLFHAKKKKKIEPGNYHIATTIMPGT